MPLAYTQGRIDIRDNELFADCDVAFCNDRNARKCRTLVEVPNGDIWVATVVEMGM
jgi:hypothetical protein